MTRRHFSPEFWMERHPWAAALLWRVIITDTLKNARPKWYGYAARHLTRCAMAYAATA